MIKKTRLPKKKLGDSEEKNEIKVMKLKLDDLTILKDVQARVTLDDKAVNEYSEMMIENASFPPIIVFGDGERHIVADGFHRFAAAKIAGKKDIEAEVRQGSIRDAIFFATGANASHGVRLTNKDKRRAVEILLKDKEWMKKTDAEIARHCSATHPFVGKIRKELTCNGYKSDSKRIGKDGRTINVENIGKHKVTEAGSGENSEPTRNRSDIKTEFLEPHLGLAADLVRVITEYTMYINTENKMIPQIVSAYEKAKQAIDDYINTIFFER